MLSDDHIREEPEVLRGACGLPLCLRDRQAGVERLQAAIRRARDSIASAILLSTFARARAASPGHGPGVERRRRRLDRPVDVLGPPAAACAYTVLLTGSATPNVAPSALGTCCRR